MAARSRFFAWTGEPSIIFHAGKALTATSVALAVIFSFGLYVLHRDLGFGYRGLMLVAVVVLLLATIIGGFVFLLLLAPHLSRRVGEALVDGETLLRCLPLGAAVFDLRDKRLVLANHRFEVLAGESTAFVNDVLSALDVSELVTGPGAGSESPLMPELVAHRVMLQREAWVGVPGGHSRHLSMSLVATGDAKGIAGSIVLAIDDTTDREKLKTERQELLRGLVNAHEDERLRLSRELHDQMGQELIAILLLCKALAGQLTEPARVRAATDILELVEKLSAEVHDTAANLRPALLNEFGLQGAVVDLVERFARHSSVNVDCELNDLDAIGDKEATLTCYRLVQEALTNIIKHSGASSASLTAVRAGDVVRLVIEDNGRGFDALGFSAGEEQRLGLAGMRERISLIGGTMEVDGNPGSGAAIFANIPVGKVQAREEKP